MTRRRPPVLATPRAPRWLLSTALVWVGACEPSGATSRTHADRFDFDGDGLPDAVIGDPGHGAGRGALWLVRGSPSGPLVPELLIEGEPLEALGRWPILVPDRDGDGRFEAGAITIADDGTARGTWIASGGDRGSFAGSGIDPRDGARVVAIDDGGEIRLVVRDLCERLDVACLAATIDGASLAAGTPYADVEGTGVRRPIRLVAGADAIRLEVGQWSVVVPGIAHIVAVQLAGDVDGDAREDFVVRGDARSFLVRPRAEGALVSEHRVELMPLRADLDCDGHDDLAEGALVLRGSADGPIASALSRPTPPTASFVPDLDGDGCREVRLDPSFPTTFGRPSLSMVRDGALVVWIDEAPRDLSGGVRIDLSPLFPEEPPRASRYGYETLGRTLPGMVDVDGDGDDDFVLSDLGYPLPLPLGGDVDGDGDEDMVRGGSGHWEVIAGPEAWRRRDEGEPPPPVMATLVSEGAGPVGDVDGDGLGDLMGHALCGGTCEPARTHLWLGRDLARGVSEPATTLDGIYAPIGDVNDDGLDDAIVWDFGAQIHFGDPIVGLIAEPAIVAVDLGGVMQGGVYFDDSLTTSRALAIGRVSNAPGAVNGRAAFGAPIAARSTRGAAWIDVRDDLPLVYLPEGDIDGPVLVRLHRDGTHRRLVLRVSADPAREIATASMW